MIYVECKCYLHFRIGLPACLVYGACRLQCISRGCSGKHQCASFSCSSGCAGNKGRLYSLPFIRECHSPAFMFSTATLSLRSSLTIFPTLHSFLSGTAAELNFFIGFDKLLLPVFPGSRDLAFPFRGVVRSTAPRKWPGSTPCLFP